MQAGPCDRKEKVEEIACGLLIFLMLTVCFGAALPLLSILKNNFYYFTKHPNTSQYFYKKRTLGIGWLSRWWLAPQVMKYLVDFLEPWKSSEKSMASLLIIIIAVLSVTRETINIVRVFTYRGGERTSSIFWLAIKEWTDQVFDDFSRRHC